MALQVWLPLTQNFNNCGLAATSYQKGSTTTLITSNGKLGGACQSTKASTSRLIIRDYTVPKTNITVCAWVKITTAIASGSNAAIVCCNNSTFNDFQFFMGYINDNNVLKFELRFKDTNYQSNATIALNTWYHIAFTYDGSKAIAYINNEKIFEENVISSSSLPTGQNICIGCRSSATNGSSAAGQHGIVINDVRIYDHIIKQSELNEIYKAKLLHYQFNDTSLPGLDKHHYNLPNDYQEVEYLESTGTQWINTGFIASQYPLTLNALMSWQDGFKVSGEKDFWGNYSNGLSTSNVFVCGHYSGANYWYQWGGSSYTPLNDTKLQYCQKYYTSFTYEGATGRTTRLNGVQYRNTNISNNGMITGTTNPIGLFSGAGDRNYLAASVRIYNASIKQNHILVRKLVPCYRKSDNKPGMYDLITKTFLVNAGTGEFYIGPLVKTLPNGYAPIKSTKSTGTQQINLGLTAKYGDRWTFLFENVFNGNTVVKPSQENKGYSVGNPNTLGISGGGRCQASNYTQFSVWKYGSNYQFNPAIYLVDTKGQIFEETLTILNVTHNHLYNITKNTYHTLQDIATPNATSYDSSSNMCLFMDIPYPYPGAKYMYRVTGQRNSVMLRDMIPCMRISDSVIGMYDLVNDTFYSDTKNTGFQVGQTDAYQYDGVGNDYKSTKFNASILNNNSLRYKTSTNFKPQILNLNPLNTTGLTTWTQSCWVNIANYPSNDSIIYMDRLYMAITPTGQLKAYAYGKSPAGWFTSTATTPLNTWVHMAVVWNSSNCLLYINGTLDTTSATTTGTVSGSHIAYIGAENNVSTRPFNGTLSDFRMYTTALTANEIQQLYKMGHSDI